MITLPHIHRSAVGMLLGLTLIVNAGARGQRVELLLPGDEYHQNDLPADPSGRWWVLHQPDGQPELEAMEIVVTPFRTCDDDARQTGRAVQVPTAQGSILLLRGLPGLGSGSVRTDFVDTSEAGASEQVEVPWDDTSSVVVRRVVNDPDGDQPGRYRIELLVGARRYQLHADQWHGDGHWRVRWIGDLNRDGWPDVLLDASYKYSVHTTRLFLSRVDRRDRLGDDALTFDEVGTLSSSSC